MCWRRLQSLVPCAAKLIRHLGRRTGAHQGALALRHARLHDAVARVGARVGHAEVAQAHGGSTASAAWTNTSIAATVAASAPFRTCGRRSRWPRRRGPPTAISPPGRPRATEWRGASGCLSRWPLTAGLPSRSIGRCPLSRGECTPGGTPSEWRRTPPSTDAWLPQETHTVSCFSLFFSPHIRQNLQVVTSGTAAIRGLLQMGESV